MDVEYLFFANTVDMEAKKGFRITGGGWDELSSPEFPVSLESMAFIARLKAYPIDLNKTHRFRLELRDPGGHDMLAKKEIDLTIHPTHTVNYLAATINDVVFSQPGVYQFRISSRGKTLATYRITAMLGSGHAQSGTITRSA